HPTGRRPRFRPRCSPRTIRRCVSSMHFPGAFLLATLAGRPGGRRHRPLCRTRDAWTGAADSAVKEDFRLPSPCPSVREAILSAGFWQGLPGTDSLKLAFYLADQNIVEGPPGDLADGAGRRKEESRHRERIGQQPV